MRRIYACMIVLGIIGLCGFGVMRGIAQTEAPALTPDQFKPANIASPKYRGTPEAAPKASAAIPDAVVLPSLEPQIPLAPAKVERPLVIMPPTDPKPAPLIVPDFALPEVIEPDAAPAKKDGPSIAAPKIEPIVPPVIAQPAPLNSVPAIKSEIPFTMPMLVSPSLNDMTSTSGNRMTPAVSIETIAPASVAFGQPVSYEILVKNHGQVNVTHVRVDEELGAGTKFMSAEPAGEINGDKVFWMLGSLNPGEEKHIKVSVKPGNQGDLTTKPRVTFAATTTMSVRVTRPSLAISVHAPEMAQIGDEVPVQIQITNNGSGDAAKIALKAILTDGLKHPEGNDIQAVLNKLSPGESQTVTLRVKAAAPGAQSCTLSATTEGAEKATTEAKLDVRQPKLNVAVSGPVKCMVRAEPIWSLEIANPGTSHTEPVQLAAAFPEGLDFASASDGGSYDPNTRTVSWNLPPAAPASKRNLTVKTKSSIAGHLAVRVVAQAGPKLNARAEAVIQAEGVPALMFEVVDLEDPIEVGKETTYEIRIANTGTMHLNNVRLTAALSDGLVPGTVTANMPYKVVGQTLVFEPIAKMAVKSDMIIRVRAKGTAPGDQRFKVQLSCDQMKQPVVKEESTSFFQQ